MTPDKADMPYPSQIKEGSLNPDIRAVHHRQMYALEAARLAVSATAYQKFETPAGHSHATMALAGRFLIFIMGE